MHTHAIAVVIPAHNAGRFINETIDSARANNFAVGMRDWGRRIDG